MEIIKKVAQSKLLGAVYYLCGDGNVWLYNLYSGRRVDNCGPYDEFVNDIKNSKYNQSIKLYEDNQD